jgi:hypothetical protein
MTGTTDAPSFFKHPILNNLGSYGRGVFAEFTDIWGMKTDLAAKIEEQLERVMDSG